MSIPLSFSANSSICVPLQLHSHVIQIFLWNVSLQISSSMALCSKLNVDTPCSLIDCTVLHPTTFQDFTCYNHSNNLINNNSLIIVSFIIISFILIKLRFCPSSIYSMHECIYDRQSPSRSIGVPTASDIQCSCRNPYKIYMMEE